MSNETNECPHEDPRCCVECGKKLTVWEIWVGAIADACIPIAGMIILAMMLGFGLGKKKGQEDSDRWWNEFMIPRMLLQCGDRVYCANTWECPEGENCKEIHAH